MADITEVDRAWAAGFFDGEGCFSLVTSKRSGKQRARVCISQKDPEVLQKFALIVGMGNVNGPYPTLTSVVYQWSKGGTAATHAIASILWPYLGNLKRAQANKVLQVAQGTKVIDEVCTQ